MDNKMSLHLLVIRTIYQHLYQINKFTLKVGFDIINSVKASQ